MTIQVTALRDEDLDDVHGGDNSFWRGVFNVGVGVLSGGWSGAAQAATGSTEAIMAINEVRLQYFTAAGGPDGSGNSDDGALGRGAENDGAGGVGGTAEPLTQASNSNADVLIIEQSDPGEPDPNQVSPD